ncbi:MAG: glycerol-3-phosphate dehydrogenase [Psittacicella sp.]
MHSEIKDLIVIGGGINGIGIAEDAIGRGLSVALLESHDLACSASSSTTKLIRSGLNYLERKKLAITKESLEERDIILKKASHITQVIRFCTPYNPQLKSYNSKKIRIFLYDFLGKKSKLPKREKIKFEANSILKPEFKKGIEYSDCFIDDSRLVILNAIDFKERGGELYTKNHVTKISKENDLWRIDSFNKLTQKEETRYSRGIVNASGLWIQEILKETAKEVKTSLKSKFIKGSHIVIENPYDNPKAYSFQNNDGRIVYLIPWMDRFAIIGSSSTPEYQNELRKINISDEEELYLLQAYNNYFKKQLSKDDIIWSYSGIRALSDGEVSKNGKVISKNYSIDLSDNNGKMPFLNVFSGKLTTYRKLAEVALNKLSKYYPQATGPWTKDSILPGSDIQNSKEDFIKSIQKQYYWLPKNIAKHYACTYGTRVHILLDGVNNMSGLGEYFGSTLYEKEIEYLVKYEWVIELNDLIWRRTKLGLYLSKEQKSNIGQWLQDYFKDENIYNN